MNNKKFIRSQQSGRKRDSRAIEGQQHEKLMTDEADSHSLFYSLKS